MPFANTFSNWIIVHQFENFAIQLASLPSSVVERVTSNDEVVSE